MENIAFFGLFFVYVIFSFLPIIIIIGLVWFLVKRRQNNLLPSQERNLQFLIARDENISQLFILLSFFFLGITLLAFNKDFSDPFTWRTILFVTVFLGLITAYYLKSTYLLIFSLLGFISWWGLQAVQWSAEQHLAPPAVIAGLAFLMLLFYPLGYLHQRLNEFKLFTFVYVVLGVMLITWSLYFFSTQSGIAALGSMTAGTSFLNSWQLTLSLFLFLVSLIGVTLWAASQKLISLFELLAIFALTCLFGFTAILPEQNTLVSGNQLSSTGILWAVLFNAAIFLELLGLIICGYMRSQIWLINLGALFLFLLIIDKYSDWFFTFLNKSVFFIGAGILLFVVGWFMERSRRYMISNIKTQAQNVK